MAKLYIANCTKQNQEIYFRLDFDIDDDGRKQIVTRFRPAKRQSVAPGRQIVLGGDLHIRQIQDIISQLEVFGLIGEADVPRLDRIASYVYNIDQPVRADTIRTVMASNQGILITQGVERRKAAAIVTNETVANTVNQQFAEAGISKAPEQAVEVEIEQLEQSEAGEKRIEEGYKIDPKAPMPTKAAKGGKGKGLSKVTGRAFSGGAS